MYIVWFNEISEMMLLFLTCRFIISKKINVLLRALFERRINYYWSTIRILFSISLHQCNLLLYSCRMSTLCTFLKDIATAADVFCNSVALFLVFSSVYKYYSLFALYLLHCETKENYQQIVCEERTHSFFYFCANEFFSLLIKHFATC